MNADFDPGRAAPELPRGFQDCWPLDRLEIRLGRRLAGGPWRVADVYDDLELTFRTLAAVNDLCPWISYATAADVESPWTLLWTSPPAAARRPFFAGLQDLAAAEFSPELAGLMVPVSAELVPALAGQSLAPTNYLDPDHWRRLAEARSRAAERRRLEAKLAGLFHRSKPGQAERLARLAGK